jgi:hypothetical protein
MDCLCPCHAASDDAVCVSCVDVLCNVLYMACKSLRLGADAPLGKRSLSAVAAPAEHAV